MYMKNLDFEIWKEEHKDINNNLAVPRYRAFCKAYGINFHFEDEIRDFDHNKHPSILLDEMPLHGRALSLFNFVNRPYQSFKNGLVSFTYTSWNDFDYESLSLEEICNLMESKDDLISKLKNDYEIYAGVAFISTLIATLVITSIFTSSRTFSILTPMLIIAEFVLLMVIPNAIYKKRKQIEQRKFNQKLLELKQELKNISNKYESHKVSKDEKAI